MCLCLWGRCRENDDDVGDDDDDDEWQQCGLLHPLWGLGLQDGKVRPLLFLFPAPAHAAHPRPAQSLFSAFFPQMGAVPALCRGCTSVEAPSCYYCCPRPRPQGVRVHLVGGWVGGRVVEYMERVHLSNSELCGCYRWPRGVRHDDTRHLSDPSCSGNVGLA